MATVYGVNVERASTTTGDLHAGNYRYRQKPMRLLREFFRATLGTKIISVSLILLFRSRLTRIHGHAANGILLAHTRAYNRQPPIFYI